MKLRLTRLLLILIFLTLSSCGFSKETTLPEPQLPVEETSVLRSTAIPTYAIE